MRDTTFIYGLFDPRDCQLRYIGKSGDLDKRIWEHINSAKRGGKTHRDKWVRLLLSEGLEPSIEALEEADHNNWEEIEKAWITECRKFGLNLTNLTDGGDFPPSQLGKKFSEETKEKMRQSAMGRPRTDEERRKLSESKKGKSTWVKGKHLTDEHKWNIGLANSGRKPTEEAIAKRVEKMRGRKHSEEHRQKTSNALKLAYLEGRKATRKGEKHSEETKKRMSESGKARWAKRKLEQ